MQKRTLGEYIEDLQQYFKMKKIDEHSTCSLSAIFFITLLYWSAHVLHITKITLAIAATKASLTNK